ncbi:Ubiquitin-conjugating enzyme E2 J1 [Sarcoptes scabiei]|uniref:Ubiquitin-conjugating enzyme E2 J1 n=1 Tax=Sarcoptes scabiei TaxID=52283 RepID=A0A834RJB5_SARSC|nr:Ubiquitin-conjugating enzyme E2 J1 [Sarcoptes scabiei]
MEHHQHDYSLRSPAVKRILSEAKELKDATSEYYARPLEDNIFEWHFTVRGASDSEFADGFYHGRILLPSEYPMKPPSIIILTPNGRFELNKKICLSISGHHPETWMPCWSIRTVLLAIISFMPTSPEGHIGGLQYTPDERRILAKRSHEWRCDQCGLIRDHLKRKKIKDKCKLQNEELDNPNEAHQLNHIANLKTDSIKTLKCHSNNDETSISSTNDDTNQSNPRRMPQQSQSIRSQKSFIFYLIYMSLAIGIIALLAERLYAIIPT